MVAESVIVGRLVSLLGPSVRTLRDARVTIKPRVRYDVVELLEGPAMALPESITCRLDDEGWLLSPTGLVRGVTVAASDTWSYRISVSAPNISTLTWDVLVPPYEAVDLATAVHVPPNPDQQIAEWVAVRDEVLAIRDEIANMPVGDKGPDGDPGPQGDKGLTGDKGPDGDPGPQGDKGLTGDKGPDGDPGPKGDKGLIGDKGPDGDPGPPGDEGLTGDKGPDGDPGPPGDKGLTGDKGPDGDPGPPGDKGLTGDKGPDGDPGPPGDKGLTGDKGPDGDTVDVEAFVNEARGIRDEVFDALGDVGDIEAALEHILEGS